MKKICTLLILVGVLCMPINIAANDTNKNKYTMIVEGEDWGPAITKIVLNNKMNTSKVDASNYQVQVTSTMKKGKKTETIIDKENVVVKDAYVSDGKGNQTGTGFITLELEIGPDRLATSPFYFDVEEFQNYWLDVNFVVVENATGTTWDKKEKQINVGADAFNKDSYSYKDSEFGKIDLSYGSYAPKEDDAKNPLIIWLHGKGEGGSDPNVVLLGNKVTNLISDEIQSYFGGAYVLTPQSPTFWLDQGDGNTTIDGSSMYSNALFALIDEYVKNNEDIDPERIYIGGCSNGGFMTMRMIIDNPTYFAAAFPICVALYNDYVSDEDIQKIKHMPIWFTHALSDPLAEAEYITIPTYERLLAAGAKKVHFTPYDKVVDPSGKYFMKDGVTPFEYNPHFSWIYTLNNLPTLDYDGNPVMLDDQPVTIFEWLSKQTKQKSTYKAPTFFDQYGSIVLSLGAVALLCGVIIVVGKKRKEESE